MSRRTATRDALADILAGQGASIGISRSELLRLTVALSVPTVLAELTSIAMQYIDAAMVGSLGAGATAAIGLVAATTWLVGGVLSGASTGFSVQIAQHIGAGHEARARNVLRQGLIALFAFSAILAVVSLAISGSLPGWLGGDKAILADASAYFFIFALGVPVYQMERLCIGALQCSGDMRTPSILAVLTCVLDVLFNFLLIFPTREITLFGAAHGGFMLTVPGAGLGVAGASLGTVLAETVVTAMLLWATCVRSPQLKMVGAHCCTNSAGSARLATPAPSSGLDNKERESWRLTRTCLSRAISIASPVCLERVVTNAAQIALTAIVAPLGTVAVAANSLAVTAESLCYMPGYGIGSAATTLVGQSVGAHRRDLAREFARLTTWLGMGTMTVAGAIMFAIAPWVFSLLTPDTSVQELGVLVLRIELFAEPFFGASIVVAGALRGAGDTLIPAFINLGTMWVLRVPAAALLAPRVGLVGVWIAMCGELIVCGILFLVRLYRERWLGRC